MGEIKLMMKWAMVLDVVWSIVKACGTGIELTVDPDVSQAMAMEVCFIVVGVVRGEGCLSKTTSLMGLAPFYGL